jgi:hypothetical protein
MEVAVTNAYFDFDDYDKPVKNYLDDRFFTRLLNLQRIEQTVYLRNNQIEAQDSFFAYTPGGSESEFINFERFEERLKGDSYANNPVMVCKFIDFCAVNIVLALKFTKDQQVQSYERSVFGLLALTGNLGGLFEVLERTGALLVSFFSAKIFLFSLFSSLYQVDTYKPSKQFKLHVRER